MHISRVVVLVVASPAASGAVLVGQAPVVPAGSRLPPPPAFTVGPAAGAIRVDGSLDDAGWRGAAEVPLEWEWTPGDNTSPPVRSVCRITYDSKNLYVGCRAFDPHPAEIRARYFGRDDIDRLIRDDHFSILIDPFNDQRRAYQFRVSALGGQADALLSTAEGFEDWSWDAIWGSAGRIDDQGYTVEVAIPFKSLRFPRTAGVQTWGFILERSYPRSVRRRIQSAPRDRNNTCLLCEANKVTGFPGIAPGRNIEFDPAVTASRTDLRTQLPDGPLANGNVDPSFGMDFRWGISSNLTLNATGNPDFSQVEADVLDVSHLYQRMTHEGDRVFTANLFQARLIYNLNVRTFVRAIVQYRSVDRNVAVYSFPVSEFDEGLFGQFLFSYKVNPQTVVFIGYSDDQAGARSFDLTRTNRTFFAKVGYAWRP